MEASTYKQGASTDSQPKGIENATNHRICRRDKKPQKKSIQNYRSTEKDPDDKEEYKDDRRYKRTSHRPRGEEHVALLSFCVLTKFCAKLNQIEL